MAETVFTDTFVYGTVNAFTSAPPAGGGWTTWDATGGCDASAGFCWGNQLDLKFNHPTALTVGQIITMDANVRRTGSTYGYGMKVFLWNGTDSIPVEVAGNVQTFPGAVNTNANLNLSQVSHTVTQANLDAGQNHVVFKYSHANNWSETNEVTFAVNSAPSGWTWNNVVGGSWAIAGNWTPAGPANGADMAALLNLLDITGEQSITLDGAFTIGTLRFADAAGADGNWILNSGTGSHPLTLSAPVDGSPGVIVGNQTATVNAVLTGTQGMTKTGAGTLVLAAANTYLGGTFITAGTVLIGNISAIPSGAGNGDVTLGGKIDLNDTSITLNGLTGGGMVTNSGTGTPTLTFGPEDVGTAFAGVIENGAGITSVIKDGVGTQSLSANNTFSGDLTIQTGTLSVSGKLSNVGGITVNAGATVELGAENMFLPNHSTAMDETRLIQVDGGNLNMTGQMISRIGNVRLSNDAYWISNRGLDGWDILVADTNAGPATITVANSGGNSSPSFMGGSGGIHLQGVQNFDVGDVTGDEEKDLEIAMTLANPGNVGGAAGGVNKLGSGTLLMAGVNTYTGDTIVADGTLELAEFAQVKFAVTATAGESNTITGAGTLILNGSFLIDTTAASALSSGTWTLEDVPSLSGPYGTSFTVTGFTDVGGEKWTKSDGSKLWTFDETTGVLSLTTGAGNDYATWATSNAYWTPGAPNTAPGEDFDHDGIINREEWLFGLNPTTGASANPISSPLSHSSGTFSYTRRDPALTGKSYNYEWSTSLVSWTPVIPAIPDGIASNGDNQTVTVNLTGAPGNPLAKASLFVRVVSTP